MADKFSTRDTPMLTQCKATESGGVQCEVMLTDPAEEHGHWISKATIESYVGVTTCRACGESLLQAAPRPCLVCNPTRVSGPAGGAGEPCA